MPSSPPDSNVSKEPSRAPLPDEDSADAAKPRSIRLNVILFVCTIASVILTGAVSAGSLSSKAAWLSGLAYAGSLMGILVAHESGHYIAARIHKVDASPPFFIPFPLPGSLGTMGAVIRLRGKIPTRAALLDIGASGPLCGLIFAFPLYAWGIAHSKLIPLDSQEYGQIGSSLAMRAIEHFFSPTIPDGMDILLSPVAFGAWAGMLVTMINLLPVGQLDGGHVAYALFGPRQNTIARNVHRALLVFFFVSLFSYVARDRRAGIGFSHFGTNMSNSVFWLVWFQVLAILGAVSSRGQIQPENEKQSPSLTIRTRIVSTVGLVAVASLGADSNKPMVWLAFFIGLGFLLAMEVRSGVLRPHTLLDHPPTGEKPLGIVRTVVSVVTLAMFVLLFMPTPFPM